MNLSISIIYRPRDINQNIKTFYFLKELTNFVLIDVYRFNKICMYVYIKKLQRRGILGLSLSSYLPISNHFFEWRILGHSNIRWNSAKQWNFLQIANFILGKSFLKQIKIEKIFCPLFRVKTFTQS